MKTLPTTFQLNLPAQSVTDQAQGPSPRCVNISASLVSADVSERAGGPALAGGADVELAHGGPALVHPGEGERLGAHLLGQRHLKNE